MTRWGIVVLAALALVAAAAILFTQFNRPSGPLNRDVSQAALHGLTTDAFFEMIAAYCKRHPDPSDLGSCAMCSAETCPSCGFGPERATLVSQCNPGNWDCAGSLLFAPGTGGSCAFPPAGACQCPVGGAPKKAETDSARTLAALLRPVTAAAPFSVRPAPSQ